MNKLNELLPNIIEKYKQKDKQKQKQNSNKDDEIQEKIGEKLIEILLMYQGKEINNKQKELEINKNIEKFIENMNKKYQIQQKSIIFNIFGRYFCEQFMKSQQNKLNQISLQVFIISQSLENESIFANSQSQFQIYQDSQLKQRQNFFQQQDFGTILDQKKTLNPNIIQRLKQQQQQLINSQQQSQYTKQQKQEIKHDINIINHTINQHSQILENNINKKIIQQQQQQKYENQQVPIIVRQQQEQLNKSFDQKSFSVNNNQHLNIFQKQKIDQHSQSEQYNLQEIIKQQKQQFKLIQQLKKDYFNEVIGYLRKLSKPLAELTYIKQHLKWSNFTVEPSQSKNQQNQWSCKAGICLPEQLRPQDKGWIYCTQYHQIKKQVKHLACIQLLKTLYLLYPQVWITYQHIQEQKNLFIDQQRPFEQIQKQQKQLIDSKQGYVIDGQKLYSLQIITDEQIDNYLSNRSPKSQLNTISQQIPGKIVCPKIKKQIKVNYWYVTVRLEYNNQKKGEHKPFEKTEKGYNSKKAEQQAYKQLLMQFYKQCKDIFKIVKAIQMIKKTNEKQTVKENKNQTKNQDKNQTKNQVKNQTKNIIKKDKKNVLV